MLRILKTSWKRCSGLTLIELVVALSIASVLALFLAPSFMGIILDTRLTSQINSISSSLNLARSEAINRGARVGVCGSSNQSTCDTGGQFEFGWIVFVDEDNSNNRNGSEEIIRIYPELAGNNTLRFHVGTVMYGATGIGRTAGTFVLCDKRGTTSAKALIINIVGRARLGIDNTSGTDSKDGIVNGGNGSNVTCI